MVPDWNQSLPTPNPTVPALSELAQRLNGTVLISHSQSGIYPFQTRRSVREASRALSPSSLSLALMRTVIWRLTRTFRFWCYGAITSISRHDGPRLAACKAFAEAVNKVGGKVESVVLPEIGIRGNSHMLMQDRNSLEIAAWLLAWIDRNIEKGRRSNSRTVRLRSSIRMEPTRPNGRRRLSPRRAAHLARSADSKRLGSSRDLGR